MAAISFPYQGLPEFPVKNKVNLFQTGYQEFTSARNILNQTRRILQVNDQDSEVILVGEESKIIKLVFKERKRVLMYMYYIPDTHRLDIYDDSGLVCAFERKKCIQTRCTEGLQRFGFTDLFKTIVALT